MTLIFLSTPPRAFLVWTCRYSSLVKPRCLYSLSTRRSPSTITADSGLLIHLFSKRTGPFLFYMFGPITFALMVTRCNLSGRERNMFL